MNTKQPIGRRGFLKAAATAALLGGATPPGALAEAPAQSHGAIPTRTLGKT